MTRINTNVSALIAQKNLNRTNEELAMRLQRLSTGLRINRGADDPAGLIVSERLRNEIQGVTQAVSNIERASNVIATTEASLQEINDLLVSIKGLTIEAANTGAFSQQETEANQLQIDSAVESITRISNTTTFAGLQLLNGSLDYRKENVTVSQITDVKIFSAAFGNNSSIPVTVEVINSAETAQLFLSAGAAGVVNSSFSIEIRGIRGVTTMALTSAQTVSSIVAGVNNLTEATGVSATLLGGSAMMFSSIAYGTDAFVSVQRLDGQVFTLDGLGGNTTVYDEGVDVLALVNGNLALGDGLDVTLNSPTLNLKLSLTAGAAQLLSTPYTFDITGGGAIYQIGPTVSFLQQVGFGIQSVASSRLGNSTLGFLSSIVTGGSNSLIEGKYAEAGAIIDEAMDQVSILRGRLGAFERNTLQTTMRSVQISLENLTASESSIRDADYSVETSMLTRAQILQSAGTSALALANSSAQSVLALLG